MPETLGYRVRFPIGDWSGDGHSMCDYFLVSSNRSREQIEDMHRRIREVVGCRPEDLWSEYEQNRIPARLTTLLRPVLVEWIREFCPDLQESDLDAATFDGQFSVNEFDGPKTALEIWLVMLRRVDPAFRFVIQPNPPTLYKSVGYGLFSQ